MIVFTNDRRVDCKHCFKGLLHFLWHAFDSIKTLKFVFKSSKRFLCKLDFRDKFLEYKNIKQIRNSLNNAVFNFKTFWYNKKG